MKFQLFSDDLGVDLGTSNVLIYADGKGVVIREPAVVAVDKNTGRVLEVGAGARNMLGRTPGNVVAMRPVLKWLGESVSVSIPAEYQPAPLPPIPSSRYVTGITRLPP